MINVFIDGKFPPPTTPFIYDTFLPKLGSTAAFPAIPITMTIMIAIPINIAVLRPVFESSLFFVYYSVSFP